MKYDMYSLLNEDQIEEISVMLLDALAAQDVYPELWEIDINCIVDDVFDASEVTA